MEEAKIWFDLVSATKSHVSHLLWSCKILVFQVFCVVFIWSHILRNVHSGEVCVHFLRISRNDSFFYCCWFELVIKARAISQWAACWLMSWVLSPLPSLINYYCLQLKLAKLQHATYNGISQLIKIWWEVMMACSQESAHHEHSCHENLKNSITQCYTCQTL
jgi:Na+/alanine symporter